MEATTARAIEHVS